MTSAGGGRTGRPVASLAASGSKPGNCLLNNRSLDELQDQSQLNSLLMRVSQDLVTKSLNTRAPITRAVLGVAEDVQEITLRSASDIISLLEVCILVDEKLTSVRAIYNSFEAVEGEMDKNA
jgi:hypothetical protein